MTATLVVMVSGNGTNLQAILDACAAKQIPASVVAVFSDKAEAYGLTRARQAGVDAIALVRQPGESRVDYDVRLAGMLEIYRPDYVILAGWMRLLTRTFLDHFPGRVINLHPALPGAFPGTHAIERAYAAFKLGSLDHSGVMVHIVPDEGVDNGPVLAAQEIPFVPGESLQDFEARVHAVEHQLLVETIKNLCLKESKGVY